MAKKSKKKFENNFAKNLIGIVSIFLFVFLGLFISDFIDKYQTRQNIEREIEEIVANSEVNINVDQGVPSVLIVTAQNCLTCRSEEFIGQIRNEFYPNLQVSIADSTDEDSIALIEQLDTKYLPVYLFSKEISNHSDWEFSLSQAFEEVTINGEIFYNLRIEFAPGRVLIDDIEVEQNAIVMGKEDANITIVEFSDYECPFCALVHGNDELIEEFKNQDPDYTEIYPEFIEDYVETGLVRYVFYNFPVESIHLRARDAHNAALCANAQESWFDYNNLLFEKREEWILANDKTEVFISFAEELELDIDEFESCYSNREFDTQITYEQEKGQELRVLGTPTFFIGKTHISGPIDYEILKFLVDFELANS